MATSTLSASLATEGLLEEARKRGAFATHQRGAGAIWARLSTSPEQLIQKIASTPEPYLRERREVKVQPVANVMAAGVLKTVTAPMPLIVLQIRMFSSNCFVTLTPQNNAKLDLIKRHRKSLAPSVESLSNPSWMNQRDRVTRLFRSRKGFVPHKQFQSTAA